MIHTEKGPGCAFPNRREFVTRAAGAAAAVFLGRRGLAVGGDRSPQAGGAAPGRREISVGGRRVKTVDLHCHCAVPEVMEVVKGSKLADTVKGLVSGPLVLGPERLRSMDRQGVDLEAVSINAFWYSADRELARDIIKVQNDGLAKWCAAHPDRVAAFASVALQFPELAADQLDEAVKKLGLRGVAIGGSVDGEELSGRRFDPFWAKLEELGVVAFMVGSPGTELEFAL